MYTTYELQLYHSQSRYRDESVDKLMMSVSNYPNERLAGDLV